MAQLTTPALLSLVVPCFNERDNIAPFLTACEAALPRGYAYEIIFVDDGSSDATVEAVHLLKPKRHDITIVPLELARNFGKEIAVSAGLHKSQGVAAIMIDADLQHPPSVIPKMLAAWQGGADIAIGVRENSTSYAPWVKRLGSKLFYRIINAISDVKIVPHATDFRLVDRIVIDEFTRFNEHDRMTRGLIDWLGFRRAYVPFVPAERLHGIAAYSFRKLTGLALNSFIAMSLVPLKLAGYIGFLITVLAGALGVVVVIETYILKDPWNWNISASADLAILILFLVGIILMALGMIALYIATIHTEVTNRPLYVVREARGPRPLPVVQLGASKKRIGRPRGT